MNADSDYSIIKVMLVFDIDGVLTDPHTMTFSEDALGRICADLRKGIPVALNTGRSTAWAFERVLPSLQARLDPTALTHLLLVAEKGGVRVEFQDGKPVVEIDDTVALPERFLQEAPLLLQRPAGNDKTLGDYIFWDDKRTMASFERIAEVPMEDYNRARVQLRAGIDELLAKYDMSEYIVDETVISTDVEHRTAGKHKGAEQILAWLADRKERPEHFYSFGDSPSDERMAVVFAQHGQSTFVYVGTKPLPASENDHDRVVLHGRFAEDTAAYLANL